MTAVELAKHISVTPKTIRRWAREGDFPPGKLIGGRRLWEWEIVRLHLSQTHTNMVSPNDTLTQTERIRNEALALRRAHEGSHS
jgi:hypothetical protein